MPIIKWKIKYWPPNSKNDVEKWFNKLTKDQQKSVSKLLVMLELVGNELKLPHSRSLGKGLFELRERRHEYRVYYMFHEGRIIVLLAAGDKATQQSDIKTSRSRLSEVLKHGDDLL